MGAQSDLSRALGDARTRTDALFAMVRPDALYERPIPERHRMVFYIGHQEAFDWNLIARYALDKPAFHQSFDQLFAFGIDPPPGQLPSDQPSDWPSLAEVGDYCRRVRKELDRVTGAVPEQLLHVAIEHRLMHAETFAYIVHALDYGSKSGPVPDASANAAAPKPDGRMIEISAGTAELGVPENGRFGWDNEYAAHTVEVPAFTIGKHKITNGEYLSFVREGGAGAPFFWTERNGEYFYRAMFGEIPLPLDWPVYVTYREAETYAKARGRLLPTEAQFHRAASVSHQELHANLDFGRWDPVPVTANDNGAATPSQLIGNGWEWTSTPFAPFPGFTAFPFYRNYSEPFFDGEHYVLKGASPGTAARLARLSFRNWFRPSYPYIYSTFRLAGA